MALATRSIHSNFSQSNGFKSNTFRRNTIWIFSCRKIPYCLLRQININKCVRFARPRVTFHSSPSASLYLSCSATSNLFGCIWEKSIQWRVIVRGRRKKQSIKAALPSRESYICLLSLLHFRKLNQSLQQIYSIFWIKKFMQILWACLCLLLFMLWLLLTDISD